MKRGYRRRATTLCRNPVREHSRACLDSMLFSTAQKKSRTAIIAVRLLVRPWGVEPQSSEPESDILSIELRAHFSDLRWQKYKINVSFAKRFMQNL